MLFKCYLSDDVRLYSWKIECLYVMHGMHGKGTSDRSPK